MELSDHNTELKDVDPICKRKRYIKKCLEKNVYDQLVGIIIEYDYDFGGNLYKIIDTTDTILSIQALSDYEIVVCSVGNTLKILDINSNEYTSITHKNKGVFRTVISPYGYIITISYDSGTIDVWNKNNNCIMQILENTIMYCVTCLSDGRIVTVPCLSTGLTIWNPNNGKPEIEIKTDSSIQSIAALTDQLLVSGDSSGNVKIWDSMSGECKRTLVGHTSVITCIAVHPDGLIVSGSCDKTIKIWNHDGQCVNTLEGHNENVYNVSVLPNGMILSQSHNMLKMWNPLKGDCILSLEKNHIRSCTVLKNGLVACISDDNKIVVYY